MRPDGAALRMQAVFKLTRPKEERKREEKELPKP